MDRTDYDETPQRDSDHPGYKFIFENRETSIHSEVTSDEQQTDFKKITNLSALPTATNYSGYYSNGKRKTSNSESSDKKEIPKQDLLLGDEYKLSPADTPYDSCLPYPLSLFYPTIATQTISSDFIAAEQLWATKPLKKAPETNGITSEVVWKSTKTIMDENKRKPARVVDESGKSSDSSSGSPTKLFIGKHQPKPKSVLVPPRVVDEVTKSDISSENSSKESSTKIFINKYQFEPEMVPARFADEADENIDKTPKGSPTEIIPSKVVEEKRTSETSTGTSPKTTAEPSNVAEDLTSIGASDEIKNVDLKPETTDNESALSAVSSITSVEADTVTAPQSVGIHFERKTESPSKQPVQSPVISTLKKISKEGETTGSEASFVNYTFISANNINANYDDGANEPSVESVISVTKSDDSAFTALCKKLDAKYSSSPTNSQMVYIQEVVNELDK